MHKSWKRKSLLRVTHQSFHGLKIYIKVSVLHLNQFIWGDNQRWISTAFNQGKVKSFTKTTAKKHRSHDRSMKSKRENDKIIAIECEEADSAEAIEFVATNKNLHYEIKEIDHSPQDIIIEPYDEYEEDEEEFHEEPECSSSNTKPASEHNNSNILNHTGASLSSFAGSGMLSNELFLKSLQATLDKLPDGKNMLARIKMQEVCTILRMRNKLKKWI